MKLTGRRSIQFEYNKKHGITPTTVIKSKDSILDQTKVADSKKTTTNYYSDNETPSIAADPVVSYMSSEELEKLVVKTKKSMERADKDLDFIEAARLRDELFDLQKLQDKKKVKNA